MSMTVTTTTGATLAATSSTPATALPVTGTATAVTNTYDAGLLYDTDTEYDATTVTVGAAATMRGTT